jgi:hypothetical protein
VFVVFEAVCRGYKHFIKKLAANSLDGCHDNKCFLSIFLCAVFFEFIP